MKLRRWRTARIVTTVARRILLLNTDLEIGGTPTVVRELAIRLTRAGNAHVEVACLSRWGPVADEIAAAGVPVHALNAASVVDVGVVFRLVRLIHSREFDTIFSFLIHANAAAAAASPFCRNAEFLQSMQSSMPNPRWHWRLQGLIHHAAERMIVPSPSVAMALRDWADVPAEKISVVPNAIDPHDFEPSQFSLQPPRPCPIGFIGRLDPVKRVDDLLEAVRLLGDKVHLHIYGYGPEENRIRQQIRDLGIADRVTMHGVIARPQEALRQLSILVLPSIAEGFGLVLIEAMAARVAVIGTNVPGIRDVITDGVSGLLVPSRSPAALAEAIEKLIADPHLRQSLIQNALHDVKKRFTWESVLPRYQELLRISS